MSNMFKSDNKFGISDAMLEAVKNIINPKSNKSIDGEESGSKEEKDEKPKINRMKKAEHMKEAMKCPKCGKASCMCESVDKNVPFDGVKAGKEKKDEKAFVAGVEKMKKKEGMKEELVGKQKKLDKNHNGKLDKQDFEMLRGKKKMEEEVEFSEAELARIEAIAKSI